MKATSTGIRYDDDLNPIVTHYNKGQVIEVLTGEDAKRYIKRGERTILLLTVLFFPLTVVFQILVGIHSAIEWLLERLFR